MKSFTRYAVTIGTTVVATAALAFAIFGSPTATAQPTPPPAVAGSAAPGSAAAPGSGAAPQPGSGASVEPDPQKNLTKQEAEKAGLPTEPAPTPPPPPDAAGSAAGSAAGAGSAADAGSAAGAGSGSGATPAATGAPGAAAEKPKTVTVDCATAPKDAPTITTGKAGFIPANLKIEQNAVVRFKLEGADAVQPYPDGEQSLRAPAGQTTCIQFPNAGEFRFTSTRPIEGTVAVQTWYEKLAERPIDEEGNFWMPKSVNVEADSTDKMFYAVFGLSLFFFTAITIAVVYFVIKYRHRPGHKAQPSAAHNDALEITWTVIPTIICVFLFYYGWRSYVRVVTPPNRAVEINVLAWRWNWQFTHSNGVQDKDLHVPVNTPVRLVMTSKDVLHAFYAPVMRVKQDIVPRRYTYAWFYATKPGTYRLSCAEYCGTDHSQMGITKDGRRAVVVVHEPGKYEQYLADEQARSFAMPPAQLGAKLYDKKGCVSCHSIDGTPRVGPSLKGIFGKPAPMSDGSSVTVDESYIEESLLKPQAKIHQGYPPTMPSFQGQLKPVEIQGLIEFIKSLK